MSFFFRFNFSQFDSLIPFFSIKIEYFLLELQIKGSFCRFYFLLALIHASFFQYLKSYMFNIKEREREREEKVGYFFYILSSVIFFSCLPLTVKSNELSSSVDRKKNFFLKLEWIFIYLYGFHLLFV